MYLVQQGVSMLVILTLVDWTAEQAATVSAFAGGLVTLLFLFWQTGQSSTPSHSARETPESTSSARRNPPD